LVIWKLAQKIANIYYRHNAIPKILNESELQNPFKKYKPEQS